MSTLAEERQDVLDGIDLSRVPPCELVPPGQMPELCGRPSVGRLRFWCEHCARSVLRHACAGCLENIRKKGLRHIPCGQSTDVWSIM